MLMTPTFKYEEKIDILLVGIAGFLGAVTRYFLYILVLLARSL